MAASIAVYESWDGNSSPTRLGILHARRGSGREVFEFAFDLQALATENLTRVQLDPRLGFFEGPQFPPQGRENFGLFCDSSPDRWGRLLMRRRLEREKRAGRVRDSVQLHESDYLLGVHDAFRVGALRFRLDEEGDFLDNRHGTAAPPLVQLRRLEEASRAIESDEENTTEENDEWLRLLIAPGGSLGGARPKASVVDEKNQLWIAKFPSVRDEHDVGAWELVVHSLAASCGLRVAEGKARRFASSHHTFLVKRFDRRASGERIHFASAMTLTDHTDGDDASTGASYLEIARCIIESGAQPDQDLRELWSRLVFNILVSNTDDHLRNHGFLLEPGIGWRLSEAFDMNPDPRSHGLKINISESDNALDLELARSVAKYFRLSAAEASEIVEQSRRVVRLWKPTAARLGIGSREIDRMAPAFRLAD
ncbi:MAG: HipA domain-containing protein [Thermoanaerobaculia bacterium]|nr:HipA domain-containing protein [Thermoanaerobaculia bacterium]MBP9823556.1 HipA domain-containing protein [Thermoanaerobaculia bacterium]